ncbi:MAG: phosphatase PAP2 family protein [Armatimonadota bacterium]
MFRLDTLLLLDRQITLWINQHNNPVLDVILGTVSRLGDAGVAWLLVIVILLMFGTRRERVLSIIFLTGLIITEYLAMPVLQGIWYRPRPYMYMDSIHTLGPEWHRPSFPSSHSHLWGQAALLFAVAYPRLRRPLIVLLLLTLYSRPYTGNHHVLDVLAGVSLGLAMGGIDVLVAQKLGVLDRSDEEEPDAEPQLAADSDPGGG